MHIEQLSGKVLDVDVEGKRWLQLEPDGTIFIVTRDSRSLAVKPGRRPNISAAFSLFPASTVVVTAWDGVVETWGVDPAGPLSWYLPDDEKASAVAFSPKNMVAVGTKHGKVVIFQYAAGDKLATLDVSGAEITRLQYIGWTLLVTDKNGTCYEIPPV